MKITVNGVRQEHPGSLSAEELLTSLGVDATRTVVEHNGAIVSREDLGATALADGDVIEVVHFVSGG